MKVALVHDYIKEYGGAEKVLESLHEIFPDAPIYTTIYCPSYLGPHRARFEKYDIKTSFLQYLPFKEKLVSPFRIISPLAFNSFDFSKFDVIIVSQTGAYFPNFVKKSAKGGSASGRDGAKLICYTHTPPRYLYGYKTAREWKNNKLLLILGEIANHFLRLVDFKAAQNVDQFIANSEEVKARIKKFYRRDAVVVYPPAVRFSKLALSVQIKEKKLNANQLDAKRYFLTGGRLARAKGIDIIIDAFIKLGLPLKIFGKGFAGYEEDLKSKILNLPAGKAGHKSRIEFVGEVSDEEKFDLMKNAKAFVFASYDEDFGITPVEAMSVGTPVIAFKSGGVKETVMDGSTGLFYEPNTPENLIKAVKKFEHMKIDQKDCINQAQNFSEEDFRRKIKELIKATLS